MSPKKSSQPKQPTAPQKKPLISVKKEINDLIDSWHFKNIHSIETIYFEKIKNCLPNKDIYWNMARSILQFSINVNHVEIAQKFAPQWKNHISKFYPICDKEFFRFISKIEGEFKNTENIVDEFLSNKNSLCTNKTALTVIVHQHVISQLIILIKHMPSQFYRYSFSREFGNTILEKLFEVCQ